MWEQECDRPQAHTPAAIIRGEGERVSEARLLLMVSISISRRVEKVKATICQNKANIDSIGRAL